MAAALHITATFFVFCLGSARYLANGPLEKEASTEEMLPSVAEATGDQDPVYKEMETKITALQQHLRSSQDQALASLRQKRMDYEKALQADQSQCDHLRRENEDIKSQIKTARNTNKQLREDARILVRKNKAISTMIDSFLSNMTLAQEFATASLERGKMDYSSEVLSILSELDENDKKETHSQRLADMLQAGSHHRQLSLYQSNSAQRGLGTNDSSASLVQALSDSLEELPNQQQASEEMLTQNFNAQHGGLQVTITALLQEQSSLNQTLTSELALQNRLYDAKDHLSSMQTKLATRSAGLQQFALKLGREPLPVHKIDASLLQLAQDHKNKTFLPDPSEYLEKPREVLKTMSDHVDALESRLTDVTQQHTAEMSKQKAAFEANLSQQNAENHRLQQANIALESEIEALQETTQGRHEIAKSLVEQNNGMRTKLQSLVSNMSYAQEFTEWALNYSQQQLRNATALQVLRDLEAADVARISESEHARSLMSVADPSKISMLEVGARLKPRQHPQDLLQMLAASLNDLSKEQNASVVSLQEQFDAKFHQGEIDHQVLLDKQSELAIRKAQQLDINQRLADAVDHLKTVRETLLTKIQSVQGFIATVSKKALPRREETQSKVSEKAETEKQEKLSKNNKTADMGEQTDHSKNKKVEGSKVHKHDKAALVQVNPKAPADKVAAKVQKKVVHSMTRGHMKLVEEHKKEHAQIKPHKKVKAEPARAVAKDESSSPSSLFHWLRGVVGKVRQALN